MQVRISDRANFRILHRGGIPDRIHVRIPAAADPSGALPDIEFSLRLTSDLFWMPLS